MFGHERFSTPDFHTEVYTKHRPRPVLNPADDQCTGRYYVVVIENTAVLLLDGRSEYRHLLLVMMVSLTLLYLAAEYPV